MDPGHQTLQLVSVKAQTYHLSNQCSCAASIIDAFMNIADKNAYITLGSVERQFVFYRESTEINR